MKKVLAIVAVMLMAAPAVANDSLLAQLGLSGLQVVTAEEASQVSGLGFVSSVADSSVAVTDAWEGFDMDVASSQDLTLEGIQALAGAVTSASQMSFDGSYDEDGVYGMYNMTMSVGAGSTAVGSAD